MSRVPRARTPSKPSNTTPLRERARTNSTPGRPMPKTAEPPLPSAAPTLSIKEAIALKRLEAKKAAKLTSQNDPLDDFSSLEDAIPTIGPRVEVEEDALGRWSVRETIERGRNSGVVNLSARSLPCIPSALFDVHLGITPDPLKSVPNEPVLPPSDALPSRRGTKRDNPNWFEAQDLTTLKIWSNDIVEIQHEISLFGSLKVFDAHKNQITSLPKTFGDLTNLTSLDLSHNSLKELPTHVFSFPELTVLNISHNQFTSLPFNAPFSAGTKKQPNSSGGFFGPVIVRSSVPLPRLVNLDASHNNLTAESINLEIPAALVKLDFSSNPLGDSVQLIKKLSSLSSLKEIRMEHADIGDESFPETLISPSSFPRLRILDLSETRVTPDTIKSTLGSLDRELSLSMTTEDPPEGVLLVAAGKKVIREAWEIEAERRAKARAAKLIHEDGIAWGESAVSPRKTAASKTVGVVEKEGWEIEAEQGLLSEGAKRRARAQAAAAATDTPTFSPSASAPTRPVPKGEIVKEAWEIEAEQGLLTEGGKRRARAAALAAEEEKKKGSQSSSSSSTPSLANSQYYNATTNVLVLPPSVPPSKSSGLGHGRAFSFAPSSSFSSNVSFPSDFAVPIPSGPFAEIAVQPFALTLRVLKLNNRRADRSFTLPTSFESVLLPNLEELDLEGCNFGDTVAVSTITDDSPAGNSNPTPTSTSSRTQTPLLPLLSTLFPSLITLNLSYNAITSASLTPSTLTSLILASQVNNRKGLKHLLLRGNRIDHLDGFAEVAVEMFKGNREAPKWKLDELDLRENDIGRLPPEVGMLPLDVFLVDGNAFRVPPRRIWEREGTKGLLSWLRGRMD